MVARYLLSAHDMNSIFKNSGSTKNHPRISILKCRNTFLMNFKLPDFLFNQASAKINLHTF